MSGRQSSESAKAAVMVESSNGGSSAGTSTGTAPKPSTARNTKSDKTGKNTNGRGDGNFVRNNNSEKGKLDDKSTHNAGGSVRNNQSNGKGKEKDRTPGSDSNSKVGPPVKVNGSATTTGSTPAPTMAERLRAALAPVSIPTPVAATLPPAPTAASVQPAPAVVAPPSVPEPARNVAVASAAVPAAALTAKGSSAAPADPVSSAATQLKSVLRIDTTRSPTAAASPVPIGNANASAAAESTSQTIPSKGAKPSSPSVGEVPDSNGNIAATNFQPAGAVLAAVASGEGDRAVSMLTAEQQQQHSLYIQQQQQLIQQRSLQNQSHAQRDIITGAATAMQGHANHHMSHMAAGMMPQGGMPVMPGYFIPGYNGGGDLMYGNRMDYMHPYQPHHSRYRGHQGGRAQQQHAVNDNANEAEGMNGDANGSPTAGHHDPSANFQRRHYTHGSRPGGRKAYRNAGDRNSGSATSSGNTSSNSSPTAAAGGVSVDTSSASESSVTVESGDNTSPQNQNQHQNYNGGYRKNRSNGYYNNNYNNYYNGGGSGRHGGRNYGNYSPHPHYMAGVMGGPAMGYDGGFDNRFQRQAAYYGNVQAGFDQYGYPANAYYFAQPPPDGNIPYGASYGARNAASAHPASAGSASAPENDSRREVQTASETS